MSAEPVPEEPYAEVRETHSGVVLMLGERCLKLKRPVSFGFLDFTRVDDRRRFCAREVELNRRLAPDVYLGVGSIEDPVSGPEPVVVMRRMPASRRLALLVREGRPIDGELLRVARAMATFHAGAARSPVIDVEGRRDQLRERWRASFAQVRDLHSSVLDPVVVGEVESRVERYLAGRGALFDERIAAGRIVDGHGDLLAEDVFCLPDGPRILDCLEFDDRLRYVDQVDDVACLAMDVERLGAPGSAIRFLDAYAELSGVGAPPSLVHHLIAYRAFVRAKVACLHGAAHDRRTDSPPGVYARIALEHLVRGTVRLVLVGGPPGVGKSTLSGSLADRMGWVVLSSDRVRKELAGLDPEASAAACYDAGIYDPEHTDRTYAELLHRTELLLTRGESVVLDASWHDPRRRADAAALAEHAVADLHQLECQVDVDAAVARIASRRQGCSDADTVVARTMREHWTPWPEAVPLDTSGALVDTLDRACTELGCAPVDVSRILPRRSMMAPD